MPARFGDRPTQGFGSKIAHRVLAGFFGASIAVGGILAAAADSPPGYAPDPASQASKKHWIFHVSFRNGQARVENVKPEILAEPAATARRMGRFAIELYVGQELLDRVKEEHLRGCADRHIQGISTLCAQGILGFNTSSKIEGEKVIVSFSYHWTELGNSVLNLLELIPFEELQARRETLPAYFLT